MMSAKYFEYYTIILRGPFFRGHTECHVLEGDRLGNVQPLKVGRKTAVEFPCASDDEGGVCVRRRTDNCVPIVYSFDNIAIAL